MLAIGLANFFAMPTLSISPPAAGEALGFATCANAVLAESAATNKAALMVLKVFINEMEVRIRI
jgi:hypothetical protein